MRGSRAKAKPKSTPAKAKSALAAKAQSAGRPQAKETLKVILAQLDDMKAEETVTIDLKGSSSVADYVVVTTGRVNRHVASIADRVVEGLHGIGVRTKVEGLTNADWVLIDAGDVIVHVFRPEVRTFYNLEKMWVGTAPRRAG